MPSMAGTAALASCSRCPPLVRARVLQSRKLTTHTHTHTHTHRERQAPSHDTGTRTPMVPPRTWRPQGSCVVQEPADLHPLRGAFALASPGCDHLGCKTRHMLVCPRATGPAERTKSPARPPALAFGSCSSSEFQEELNTQQELEELNTQQELISKFPAPRCMTICSCSRVSCRTHHGATRNCLYATA